MAIFIICTITFGTIPKTYLFGLKKKDLTNNNKSHTFLYCAFLI